jgi:primosomal protein N' (replication factor Y)
MVIIRVALSVPVDTLFDYQAEDANTHDIGLRVCVPFGKKKLTGIIMAIGSGTQIPIEKLKSVYCIFREINPLPPVLLDLFQFCSQYYHHPLGMVIMNSLPVLLRNNKPVKLKDSTQHPFRLTDSGRQIDITTIPARNRVARRLLVEFQNADLLTVQQIKQISPRTSKLLIEWKQLGWITEEPTIEISPSKTAIVPTLSADQVNAV